MSYSAETKTPIKMEDDDYMLITSIETPVWLEPEVND